MEDSRTPIVTAPEDLILSMVVLAAWDETGAIKPATKALTAKIMGNFLFFIDGLTIGSFFVKKATVYLSSIFNRLYIKWRPLNPFKSAKTRVSTNFAFSKGAIWILTNPSHLEKLYR